MSVIQCQRCGKPRFSGAYGYVGPVCECVTTWQTFAIPPAILPQPCNCIGPQNGQPLCPCQMRGLIQRDGRWIRPEQDLGPVRPESKGATA